MSLFGNFDKRFCIHRVAINELESIRTKIVQMYKHDWNLDEMLIEILCIKLANYLHAGAMVACSITE